MQLRQAVRDSDDRVRDVGAILIDEGLADRYVCAQRRRVRVVGIGVIPDIGKAPSARVAGTGASTDA